MTMTGMNFMNLILILKSIIFADFVIVIITITITITTFTTIINIVILHTTPMSSDI